jgi:predicted ATPase with chaperone activity
MLKDAATKIVSYLEEPFVPAEPKSLTETGLDALCLSELLLKNLYMRAAATSAELADELGLPLSNVVEALLESLRRERFIEARNTPPNAWALTDEGQRRAREALEQNHYSGYAPVPLTMYQQAVQLQALASVTIHEEAVRHKLSDLVLSGDVVSRITAAVNAAHALFLYGASGNGKTALAQAIAGLYTGTIYVPYALWADGHIIKVFDPSYHRVFVEIASNDLRRTAALRAAKRYDKRWAFVYRPTIIVGSELSWFSLELAYDAATKAHSAPLQLKANGGVLVIDDVGRQQMRARDLLNRWLTPLERRVDTLISHSGHTLVFPFDVFLIFATNLSLSDIADDALLRRIRYKIALPDPNFAEYRELFKRACAQYKLPYDDVILAHLLQEYYVKPQQPLRASHPQALAQILGDMARARRTEPALSKEWIDEACRAYFVE